VAPKVTVGRGIEVSLATGGNGVSVGCIRVFSGGKVGMDSGTVFVISIGLVVVVDISGVSVNPQAARNIEDNRRDKPGDDFITRGSMWGA
jgi:hypothetical protein